MQAPDDEVGYKTQLQVINEMAYYEKLKLVGNKLGICPEMKYLCDVAAITREPLQYSLMVESKKAIVLSVSRYDLNNRFP